MEVGKPRGAGVPRDVRIDYEDVKLFSHSVMSNSLWPHRPQHARLPCPSASPGACSNSCPLSWWCHPTISSSAIAFSSCLQSFSASGSFPMSRLFASAGQSIGASASVLSMNIQGWFSCQVGMSSKLLGSWVRWSEVRQIWESLIFR